MRINLNLGSVSLALVAGIVGWVLGDLNKQIKHPDPILYQAALYPLHVRAVDSVNGEALAFRVSWEDRELSPFGKGSGPGRIAEFPDGAKSINLVGLPLAHGLKFEILSEGYESETVLVRGHASGIGTDFPDDVVTVKLVKRWPGSPETGHDP